MSENILATLKIYAFTYICLMTSNIGIYIMYEDISLYAVSIITTILPIILLINVFYIAIKESKNA